MRLIKKFSSEVYKMLSMKVLFFIIDFISILINKNLVGGCLIFCLLFVSSVSRILSSTILQCDNCSAVRYITEV